MAKFSENIENLKNEILRLETGLNKVKTDLEACLSSTKSEIKSEIVKVIENLQTFTNKINQYDEKIDFIERQQHSANIVLTGIPFIATESIENIFTKITNAINFEKGLDAVDTIYWMKSPKLLQNDQISKKQIPIFVRFISQRFKLIFFKQYITFKNLSLYHIGLDVNTRIYCNNYLSKHNYSLLQAAKKVKQTGNIISKVFTKSGLVYVTYIKNNKNSVLKNIEELNDTMKQQVSIVQSTVSIEDNQAITNHPKRKKKSTIINATDHSVYNKVDILENINLPTQTRRYSVRRKNN